MINTDLIHPPLLEALARLGHGSTVLIADGNYPVATAIGPNTKVVWLNITPGLLTVEQVLDVLLRTIPIEGATMMHAADGRLAPTHAEYSASLPDIAIATVDRFRFYELARNDELGVLIATGDQRPFGNLLLTIGMR